MRANKLRDRFGQMEESAVNGWLWRSRTAFSAETMAHQGWDSV